MALNPSYMVSPNLQETFIDKTTLLPLTAGIVTYYSDVNRSSLKSIYRLSGSAPNYTYTQLANPLTLGAAGTPVDENGADIRVYYYPYDADGNIENYYITVESADNVPQLVREAWPNVIAAAQNPQTENSSNFIPNGQFLLHNNIPEDSLNNLREGEIRAPVTLIAQGGWTFERPLASTATDIVTFFRYGEYVLDPTESPRFAALIQCLGADPSDLYKDLRIQFDDVNKFASDDQQYTFAFNASVFESGNFPVTLNLIKFYGTGGSPSFEEIIELTTFNITDVDTLFSYSFSFGDNVGKGIGDDNNDYVQLALSFPTTISFGGQVTDFMLLIGEVSVTGFPVQTDRDMIARSNTPPVPDYDGYDLFLPQVNSQDGLIPYDADIGLIYAAPYNFASSLHPTTNLMLLDGSQYPVDGYSPLGIPYRRVQQKWFDPTLNQPLFGTGSNFFACATSTTNAQTLFLATNQPGPAVHAADGLVATGFTFFNIANGITPDYVGNFIGYLTTSPNTGVPTVAAIYFRQFSPSSGNIVSAGNSGFTVSTYRNEESQKAFSVFLVTPAVPVTASHQFNWFLDSYYMWFTVDGVGTDPAAGDTAVPVRIKSTYSQIDLTLIIAFAISRCQIDSIVFTSGSSITPGAYFTVTATNSNAFAIWYSVNGVGTAPNLASTTNIEVAILSGDSASAVTTKTKNALNNAYFASPDLRGLFLRGFDPNSKWDVESKSRFSLTPGLYGNKLATTELDQILSHDHHNNGTEGGTPGALVSGVNYTNETQYTGGQESRPVNFGVNWVTKY